MNKNNNITIEYFNDIIEEIYSRLDSDEGVTQREIGLIWQDLSEEDKSRVEAVDGMFFFREE